MKHYIAVVLFIAVVTVLVAFGLNNLELLPPLASVEGKPIDELFGLHIQVIAFLFALIMCFGVYSIIVFRRKPGETGDGVHFKGNTVLEIVWTVIPLGIVLYFSYLGAVALDEITGAKENELVVRVISSQWSWRFDYPEYDISSATMNVPVNRTILLELEAIDVIHSFWVPEFRVKQDAVPGMTKPLRITPTELGEYTIRCAELCGRDHTTMYGTVNVMEPAAFEEWVENASQPLTEGEGGNEAERGQQVAELNGCIACHSVDGEEGVGPTWSNLYGEERALADGSTVVADEEYLREAILEPGVVLAEGYSNVMPPSYEDTLSEEDVDLLIEYIKSLNEEESE